MSGEPAQPRPDDFGLREEEARSGPRPFVTSHPCALTAAVIALVAVALGVAGYRASGSVSGAAFFAVVLGAASLVLVVPATIALLCLAGCAEERWRSRRSPLFRACLAYRAALAELDRRAAAAPTPGAPRTAPDLLPEELLDRRREYDGRLKLDLDRVRLPGGGDQLREVVRVPPAVVVVPLLDDGRVLLVRQYRHAVGKVLLELPAGRLEAGEEPIACAARELAEETGHAAADWRHLASLHRVPGFSDDLAHCYLATGVHPTGPPRPEPDERIEVELLPLARAVAMARRGEIHDAKTVVALLLAEGSAPRG